MITETQRENYISQAKDIFNRDKKTLKMSELEKEKYFLDIYSSIVEHNSQSIESLMDDNSGEIN